MVFIESSGQSSMTIFSINKYNLLQACIYFSVRHCLKATWLNDRDQFLYPNQGWELDTEFQNDCLAFTLFHSQNRISNEGGTNHWIPFKEIEVNAKSKFKSNFMADFILGKLKIEGNGTLLATEKQRKTPLVFSAEALAVFACGRLLWRYYQEFITKNPTLGNEQDEVNASLYDIRRFFQGKMADGRMKSRSEDEVYDNLSEDLRESLAILAQKISVKVYQYGFLKN
jgi:hypothetical protein